MFKRAVNIFNGFLRKSIFCGLMIGMYSATGQVPVSLSSRTSDNTQKDKTIEALFSHIEKKYNVSFFYMEQDLMTEKAISIDTSGKELSTVLEEITKQTGLEFQVSLPNISVRKKSGDAAQIQHVLVKVTDQRNIPIPGAYLLVDGKVKGITDTDGIYRLKLSAEDSLLEVRSLGFVSSLKPVLGMSNLTFFLKEEVKNLDEVVVTAFGIPQKEKALGYSVERITTKQIDNTVYPNLTTALSGKFSGLQVVQGGSGSHGSNEVVIRGYNSIKGVNSPLYILNGIPINSLSQSTLELSGGVDYGTPIQLLNLQDIESISVLKGANAAALYGTRAANGVILINTKSPSTGKLSATFSMSGAVSSPLVLPAYQSTYGRGNLGKHSYTSDGKIQPYMVESWGPAYDTRKYTQWDGAETAYRNFGDHNSFWQQGIRGSSTLQLSGGRDNWMNFASVSYESQEGVQPNNTAQSLFLNWHTLYKFSEKLKLEVQGIYGNLSENNRPNLSASPDNPMYALSLLPTSISIKSLEQYEDSKGYPRLWDESNVAAGQISYNQNPYWSVYKNNNHDSQHKLFGFAKLFYNPNKWLSVKGTIGTDFNKVTQYLHTALNTAYKVSSASNGESSSMTDVVVKENSYSLLATADKDFMDRLTGSFSVGTSLMNYMREGSSINTASTVSGSNELGSEPYAAQEIFEHKQIQSVYAFGRVSWDNILFLDLTGRNDWSSTLPASNRSFFYPSISGSWLVAETFGINNHFLNYLKLRSSWAKAGNDAPPYRLELIYNTGPGHLGQPYGYYSPREPNYDLKPEITTSVEFGGDVGLFNNRVQASFTYYHSITGNQIVATPVAPSYGFIEKNINAGEVQNRGIELNLHWDLLKRKEIQWDWTFNFNANRSKVLSLAKNVESIQLTNIEGLSVETRVGEPYGQIVGNAYLRDEEGNIVVMGDGPNKGLPVMSEEKQVLGNYAPDWTGSLATNFKLGNFDISCLLDTRMGGEIFSFTNMLLSGNGKGEWTEKGRERWYESENMRKELGYTSSEWNPVGGHLVEGVLAYQNPNYDSEIGNESPYIFTKEANGQYVDPQRYWSTISARGGRAIHEAFVYDASFIRIKELSVGYTFSNKRLERTNLDYLRISLVASNLQYLYRKAPGIDPDAVLKFENAIGIERYSHPTARSVGVSITGKF
ncbi:SusC/RagA family TonB-linked outer membrane protein [Limibacter armeniacum]|uniref:SusC/RagA family TonB-linked outer membrane protein n=1 Tax=Limibacter armeniacum TaxID=466084 RepID=UPI002FE682D1